MYIYIILNQYCMQASDETKTLGHIRHAADEALNWMFTYVASNVLKCFQCVLNLGGRKSKDIRSRTSFDQ